MEMLKISKNRLKYLQSLKLKKYREKYGSFLIEGRKAAYEAFKSGNVRINAVYGLSSWLSEIEAQIPDYIQSVYSVNLPQLKQISTLKTPDRIMVECGLLPDVFPTVEEGLILFLDGVQDPGNAGTIIRTADWFGVSMVVLGHKSVDLYNPKTLQATMGSIFRMPCCKSSFLRICEAFPGWTVYASDLLGDPLEKIQISDKSILVVGREGAGVSSEIKSASNHLVKINKSGLSEIDSLNVGVATGILLHKFTCGRPI
jgi:TrmH family RNA methyltransferase